MLRAPEGYTALPHTVRGLSNVVVTLVCDKCGALVGGVTLHNNYHNKMDDTLAQLIKDVTK